MTIDLLNFQTNIVSLHSSSLVFDFYISFWRWWSPQSPFFLHFLSTLDSFLSHTFTTQVFFSFHTSLSPNSDVSHYSVLFNTIFFPIFTLFLYPSRPCRRYEIYPVCADLQGQILACYKENAGKTLNCSNIAALYLQCVNNAKQVRIYRTKFSIVYHFPYLILVNCYSCFCTWVLFIFVLGGMNQHFQFATVLYTCEENAWILKGTFHPEMKIQSLLLTPCWWKILFPRLNELYEAILCFYLSSALKQTKKP